LRAYRCMSATGTRGECTVASNICAPNDNVQALSFYDFRGRMVTAVEKTSGGTTLESVTYTYDALDNRIGMDENGTQTWTLYDSGNPIMDFNSSGSLTMRYLWGPTGIVARQTSGGTVSWYLADALGTVRDLINNSGAIIDHVDFSAFGTVLDESSPTSGDRMMGFAGLERDTVTGLNLAVFREENPGTGRWDSQDPLGFAAADDNLYGYVGDGPTNAADPSGLRQGLGTAGPRNRIRRDQRGRRLYDPAADQIADLAWIYINIVVTAGSLVNTASGIRGVLQVGQRLYGLYGRISNPPSRVLSPTPARTQAPQRCSRADFHIGLRNRGFRYHGTTRGGYVQYRRPDGSIVWVRPNGQVIRLGPKVPPSGGGKPYNPRVDADGNLIGTHNPPEFISPISDPN
jgi:RHS repeat-associated protein